MASAAPTRKHIALATLLALVLVSIAIASGAAIAETGEPGSEPIVLWMGKGGDGTASLWGAIEANQIECAGDCHSDIPPHVFEAPTVDLKRCNRCHWQPPHWQQPCDGCHPGADPGAPLYTPGSSMIKGGYYESPASLEATAGELHAIHVQGSWLQGDWPASGCDSCHAPAKCEICHGGRVEHRGHGSESISPVNEVVARGSAVYGDDTTQRRNTTCVVAECHARDAVGTQSFSAPECEECH